MKKTIGQFFQKNIQIEKKKQNQTLEWNWSTKSINWLMVDCDTLNLREKINDSKKIQSVIQEIKISIWILFFSNSKIKMKDNNCSDI